MLQPTKYMESGVEMSSFPDDVEKTPEQPISELCMNLEDKFVSLQDVSKGDSMNVYVRIRPMLDSEKENEYKECIGLIDEHIVRAVAPASSSKFKMNSHLCQDIIEDFTFTAAYGSETGQFVFFQECMMETMKNFIEGQNGLVFSYGTTGSGKTFTLQGNVNDPGIIPLSLHLFFASVEDQLLDKVFFKPDKFSGVVALNDNEIKKELEIKEHLLSACNQEESNLKNSSTKSLGMLLCETFSDRFEGEEQQTTLGPEEMAQAQAAALMKEISKKCAEDQSGYCSIWVSFVEIYNENIYDLLQPNLNQRVKLTLGEDKNGDVYVKGLQEVCVVNSHEALSLLNFGQKNLRIASTKLNYQSSRSHCIFTVKVIRIPDPENMSCAQVNRLSFCDLAGSERAAKSQTTGMRLKEAGCINTSLLVLGRCLEQLRLNPSLRDKKLIPFRESKLTRLFSGFFTGRGKAVMITNASPCELTFDETLHVLRFSAIAKELRINDSYITTAANTLQSIANMWTDVRTNCKNQSQSSNKSISFDDSLDEVLQEKDELIEKLLDLAESLKSNLEREKKEKAEMEIKIRQDVCVEYTEFRDELLDIQKYAFEEERDAIREIYEKRISSIEKHYEKIISDFKLQLEESLSSDDEAESSKSVIKTPFSVHKMRLFETSANASQNETFEHTDSHSKCTDIANDSSKTKEELHKTVDYSLSLEVELEHLRKKYEDVQLTLQKTVEENGIIKKELDAYKIDVLAFKTHNDTLLREKLDLEADLKSFREDLVTVTEEKETLFQDLIESKDQLSCLNNEINKLLRSINELTIKKEESVMESKKSLEEADMRNSELKQQLLVASEELKTEKENTKQMRVIISDMEKNLSLLESTAQDNLQLKHTVEALSVDIDKLRNENISLKQRLEEAETSIAASRESESVANDKIERLKAVHLEEMKKLNDSLKKHEANTKEAEEVLKSVNKVLGNSQQVIEQKEKEISSIKEECASLKKELSEIQSVKKDMDEKMECLVANLELEKQKESNLVKELEKISEQVANFDSLQSDYLACKDEMIELKKTKLDLEEKLLHASKESDAKETGEEFKSANKALDNSQEVIEQKEKEISSIKEECAIIKKELSEVQSVKKDMEEKLERIAASLELEKLKGSDLIKELEKVGEQISKFYSLQSEYLACKDEVDTLKKAKLDLEEKLVLASKKSDNVHKLVQVLENCEIEATHKIEEMQPILEELKQKLETNSANYEKEYTVLHGLILTLEKCEAFASNKTKQFHSTSIKYVEEIMDLKNSLKAKEEAIEVLNNNMNDLQNKYKELQTSSKKQLQAEMQKFNYEIQRMEMELTEYKKMNESFKCDLTKLEAEKKQLENEYKNFKEEEAKSNEEKENISNEKASESIIVLKEIESQENKRNRNSSETKNQKIEISKNQENKRNRNSSETKKQKTEISENQEGKKRNRKAAEQSENGTENRKQKSEQSENQAEKRRNRRTALQSGNDIENKKRKAAIVEIQEDKKKNKKTVGKSENCTENKKQKTEIYQEPDENSSTENTTQEKKIGRRHLRCMSNVTNEQDSIQKKDESLSKTKTSKRKVDASEYKSPEKKNLKKVKVLNDAENAHKPENLRIMLLKNSANINDIPLPSPRMTRGRKRLVLAKELTSSPRTVRS